MPKVSSRTLATGVRQLVVQEALLMILCFALSMVVWLMPKATVMSGLVAGAEMSTRGAPAARWVSAFSRAVNRPVHSMTRSTLLAAWGSSAGFLMAVTWISLPFTTMPVAVCLHLGVEHAVDGVVLEEVGQGLGVGEVVDGDELEVLLAPLDGSAKDAATDPPETIDSNPRHGGSPLPRPGSDWGAQTTCRRRGVSTTPSSQAHSRKKDGAAGGAVLFSVLRASLESTRPDGPLQGGAPALAVLRRWRPA